MGIQINTLSNHTYDRTSAKSLPLLPLDILGVLANSLVKVYIVEFDVRFSRHKNSFFASPLQCVLACLYH